MNSCNSVRHLALNPNSKQIVATILGKSLTCLLSQTSSRSSSTRAPNQIYHSWSVLNYIHQKRIKGNSNTKVATLLLNAPNEDSTRDLLARYQYIWDEADIRIAIDGSANFLAKQQIIHTADIVCGDFDSIEPGLLDRLRYPDIASKLYKLAGGTNPKMPQIVETPSPKETDFTKALRVVQSLRNDVGLIFALYYSDGSRLDHIFGLVNTLHLIKKKIILVNIKSNTVSWLLLPGSNIIKKQAGQEMCSLVPFLGPTEVKTEGLQYNLRTNNPMTFGGLISTSNFCLPQNDSISVETNREILWSIDVR